MTAGHFESLMPKDPAELKSKFADAEQMIMEGLGFPALEITDSRECYLEKFRYKLIDQYEQTSAGIAGDNLVQMAARAERCDQIPARYGLDQWFTELG